jgi:hypothetical protein
MNGHKLVTGTLAMVIGMTMIALCGTGPAQAAPPVDVAAALRSAGVPGDIAALAVTTKHSADTADTINIAHPNGGFPGTRVDAVIDHRRQSVTVIQRDLSFEKSRLQVGWVNLRTGRAGVNGFPNAVPGVLDGRYPTVDRTCVLPTGAGPVALIVYGRLPGWTGLIPLAPEYFGYFTPAPAFVTV